VVPSELTFDPTSEPASPIPHEAELILPNMRGACVTIDGKVHTLFRFAARPRPPEAAGRLD
jgi:hypothetical protein